MLFFVDESFQNVHGRQVGALGGVGIPPSNYNRFCDRVYGLKMRELGAEGLDDREIKGTDCFAKSTFRKADGAGVSQLHVAVNETIRALKEAKALVFAVWTDEPDLLNLRSSDEGMLTEPYKQMLHHFKWAMLNTREIERPGAIYMDQLGHKEDKRAACAIQNFMVRARARDFKRLLIQVPHYTHSAVSPGLQAADLVAFLAAQQTEPSFRPELQVWWAKFADLSRPSGKRGQRPSVGPLSQERSGTGGAEAPKRR